jgi:hypothetical protein
MEHAEQAAVIAWAAYQRRRYPELELLYAIPNGNWRHKATAGKLKAEGVRRGVPDLCLPVPRGPYHGLYLELKRKGGGKLSRSQHEWLERLAAQGYRAAVAKGAEEAIRELEHYLQACPEPCPVREAPRRERQRRGSVRGRAERLELLVKGFARVIPALLPTGS